jgi:redox-sensitive bicupin YhaK (pirin superfamily)
MIGPGDVQWMTAAGGIIHEEYHSPGFAKVGGPFRMVQLWVNLPAKDKMAASAYQGIAKADIPVVSLPAGAGKARIIAGEYRGTTGPVKTFTPINLWDLRLKGDADLTLDLPEGHTAMHDPELVAAGHDEQRQGALRRHRGVFRDRPDRGSQGHDRADAHAARRGRSDRPDRGVGG